MTWSYDITKLDLPLNAIRTVLADTGPDEWLLADEVILAYVPGGVLGESSDTLAAARLAEVLATRFIAADVSEGSASASLSQLAPQYLALAKRLRQQAISGIALTPTDGAFYGPAFTRQQGDPRPVTVYPSGFSSWLYNGYER